MDTLASLFGRVNPPPTAAPAAPYDHVDQVMKTILNAKDVEIFLFDKSSTHGITPVDITVPAPTFEVPAMSDDEIASRILTKLIEKRPNSALEVAWAARRLQFLFDYIDRKRRIDMYITTLIEYFNDIPVFVSADDTQLAFGSVFWGIETARELKYGRITSNAIGNDEETILSVVGVHYSLIKAMNDMSPQPEREWVSSAISDIFMSNDKLREGLEKVYNDMKKTNITRGNSVFTLLGIFLASYADSSSPKYRDTIIAYDACTRNVYLPWCRLK